MANKCIFVVNHNNLDLRQVSEEELGHAESSDAITTKHFSHLAWCGELLVCRVQEGVLLQVGPKLFDTLSPGCFLLSVDFDSKNLYFSQLWED